MFERLKRKFRKRALGSNAIVELARFMEGMFNSPELEERCEGIKGLKKFGNSAIEEFKKEILKGTVLQIVQSETPIHSLYKAIFSTMEAHCIHKKVFSEEFFSKRQVIYDQFNKKGTDDPSLRWSDQMLAQAACWEECELFCLLYLQKLIVKTEQEDWWKNFENLYKWCVEELFTAMINEAEGKSQSPLVVALKPARDTYEHEKSEFLKGASEIGY